MILRLLFVQLYKRWNYLRTGLLKKYSISNISSDNKSARSPGRNWKRANLRRDLSHNLKPYIKSCDTHVGRMIKSRDPLASGNTALIKSPYSHGKKNQTNGSTKKNRANISDYNHKLKWLHIYLYPHFTLVHKINTFCVKNIQVRISSAKSFDGFI